MGLSKARIVAVGETPYAHEREGIEFVEKALPDSDPYYMWALVDLLDPSTGRLHELDLVVLGYSCLYLVELKAYPGRIEGDSVDWIWVTPEGRRLWRDNPRSLARRKAQILKSRLERVLPAQVRAPWIEPLIFLSDRDVKLGLQPDGLIGVVRRNNFVDAVTRHEFPGADPRLQGRAIDRPTMRAVVQALSTIGFRPRKGKLVVGSYELGTLLDETSTFQDREATHRTIPSQRRRARTYLVPEQTSVERRQQLLRAAEREAQLLHEVREHPHILRITDYVADAALGPTVLLDDFERGIPLDAFLRLEPELGFSDRIAILEQVAGALGHCHRREIVHGGLCPSAVLVRRGTPKKADDPGAIETRLYNFQLGGSQSVEATTHWSALGTESWAVYQAPELRRDPTLRTIEADIFSLGALGYLLLTGQPPGGTVADVEARMRVRRCLDPRDASNAVPTDVAEAIAMATAEILAQRANDVAEWIDLLLSAATAPAAPVVEPERSPLDARKDESVGPYKVVRILGHGATARVLEVEDADGRYALKVSLSTDHDERIAAEAAVLAKLRHPRIVRYEKQLTIAGRPCLVMSLAGQTLQRLLADEGPPSLDYASRYGADLLGALGHLEDEDVLHRDIKPANVGVGSIGKKLQSLTLFDFSLAGVPLTDVGVGTAAYRDPFLPKRGRWDFAADRYSAAIMLYEILTGQRPAVDEKHGTHVIAAERLDAAVRSGLAAFFEKAFAPAVAERHESAEAMRREWERAFEPQQATSTGVDVDEAPTAVSDAEIAALLPSTPIQAAPLTARAKNALDRAGILRVGDLRDLPQNRLSLIRGVGREVARDILAFRERWERLAQATRAPSEPPFFPGYRGPDMIVQLALTGSLASAAEVLVDAGFRTLAQLAAAPRTQVVALATRNGFDAGKLSDALAREHDAAQARNHPTTIAAWVDALLPAGKKKHQHARALFGLEAQQYSGVRELAAASGVTTAAIYIAVAKSRTEWAAHPAIAELVAEVRGVLERADGALPLHIAGTELLTRIAHQDSTEEHRFACALIRVVVELEKDAPDGIRYVRLRDGNPWLLRTEGLEAPLQSLGEIADELAARDVLAGPAEAHRALSAVVASTPLAMLLPDRLVRLAAAAGRNAAASSRLELYPRGMDARRALELSAAILPAQVSESKLRELVGARYSAAQALPPRPTLDEVVEAIGFRYVATEGVYARPGSEGRTSLHTSMSSYTRMVGVPKGPEIEARRVAVNEFDDRVRTCIERRELLVLGVSADRAPDAEVALARRFGLQPQSFDQRFLAELEAQMAKGRVQDRVVYDADAGGLAAAAWPNLVKLAKRTANALAERMLPPTEPLLLTQPGLIDRYGLTEFLQTLVKTIRDQDAAAAVLLLVPGYEGGTPRIGNTPVPDLLPGQSIWMPKSWIGSVLENAAALQ